MRHTITRRDFLTATTASVAAPWLMRTGAEARAAAPVWKMRLSTSSVQYVPLPIEQVCERIAKLGFEAIDIWGPLFKCTHLDDVAARLSASGLKKLLAKNKLKLFAFSVYPDRYPQYAELLGAAGGGVAIRSSEKPCKPEELTARMKEFLEKLKPQVELAEKHNSYVAVENHGRALLDSIDSIKAFVDLNKHPRVGIALAPYHIQAGQMSVEDAVAACGKQLLFFYAWQHGKGTDQLPGHGPTDMTPWLAALAKIGYAGYVNPFMHGEVEADAMSAALAKARDYLKACYKKAVA
ncbi:MAG: sugar phosphate isomerase/epimerase [Verrucomicrobia bacterium]|nr:sugar phosphate isomerase/epimerase [Verrucomicrobiota bacterium]